jgi:hypothetical protein
MCGHRKRARAVDSWKTIAPMKRTCGNVYAATIKLSFILRFFGKSNIRVVFSSSDHYIVCVCVCDKQRIGRGGR